MLLDTMQANGVVPGVNAPFTNPIVDLANVVGSQLLNPARYEQGFFNPDGSRGSSSTWARFKIPVKDDISSNVKSNTIAGYVLASGAMFINENTTTGSYDFPPDFGITGIKFIGFNFRRSDSAPMTQVDIDNIINGFMINYGLTSLPYEAFARNDASLVNFSATTGSGYEEVLAPNGKLVTMLKPDGVDDYGILPNSADLDPTGLDDFGMAFVIRTGSSVANTMYIMAKTSTASQYGFLLVAGGTLSFKLNNINNFFGIGGGVQPNSFYIVVAKRVSSQAIVKVNQVEVLNVPNTEMLVSEPNIRMLNQATNLEGTTHGNYFNGHLGLASFTLNPTEQWENAFNQLANQIYGL